MTRYLFVTGDVMTIWRRGTTSADQAWRLTKRHWRLWPAVFEVTILISRKPVEIQPHWRGGLRVRQPSMTAKFADGIPNKYPDCYSVRLTPIGTAWLKRPVLRHQWAARRLKCSGWRRWRRRWLATLTGTMSIYLKLASMTIRIDAGGRHVPRQLSVVSLARQRRDDADGPSHWRGGDGHSTCGITWHLHARRSGDAQNDDSIRR